MTGSRNTLETGNWSLSQRPPGRSSKRHTKARWTWRNLWGPSGLRFKANPLGAMTITANYQGGAQRRVDSQYIGSWSLNKSAVGARTSRARPLCRPPYRRFHHRLSADPIQKGSILPERSELSGRVSTNSNAIPQIGQLLRRRWRTSTCTGQVYSASPWVALCVSKPWWLGLSLGLICLSGKLVWIAS